MRNLVCISKGISEARQIQIESSSQKKAFSLRLKINANKEPKRGFNYHLIKSKQDNVIIGSKLAPRANFL